jgi:hypothetical protein
MTLRASPFPFFASRLGQYANCKLVHLKQGVIKMFAGNSDVTLLNSLSLFAIKEIKKAALRGAAF